MINTQIRVMISREIHYCNFYFKSPLFLVFTTKNKKKLPKGALLVSGLAVFFRLQVGLNRKSDNLLLNTTLYKINFF